MAAKRAGMTQADWTAIWKRFQQARDLPPSERERLLEVVAPHIREEGEALLAEEAAEPEHPAPGKRYEKYTLVAPLGAGGMGVVFSARDEELGRLVAIKFVGPRARMLPEAMQRLVREAQAASALNHPNLV